MTAVPAAAGTMLRFRARLQALPAAVLLPATLAAIACASASFAAAAERPPRALPLEVGTARGAPGQKARGVLKAAEQADGSPVALPVVVLTGRKPGPVVWVDALTHGDEFGGGRALQEVVRGLDPGTMAGAVVGVMVTNPPAFQALQRVNPSLDDLEDMGGAYTGHPDRFATERIAAVLAAQVREKADYFIDLHTGGDRFRQHPFVLYSLTGGVPEERYDELAESFGVPTLWRDTERVFPNDAVTTYSAAGIPSFLLEVGGGQPLNPADVRLQADAVRSFLAKVGVIATAPARHPSFTIVTGYRIVTNGRGGFFDAVAKPGDRVHEGTVLGTITDAQGDLVETMRAPAGSDIVLGMSTYPAAPTGGWLFELGSGLTEKKGTAAP
jgi:uncharacterized protein